MDFPKILENVTEVLFQLCNDLDSDIRLVAVDCLNRIVRALRGILINKFQMEVFREIKRNQAPRSLRTALSIFASMSSDIRPNRCRGFIQSLLPSLLQIAKRTEELLYENLAMSFLQILKNLGLFLSDTDVKLLCKEYLQNLESNSTVVRRSSASILVYVCQFSRKPNIFLPRLLAQALELLMPVLMEKNASTLIGVLLCVRQCIPPLYEELHRTFPGFTDKEIVYSNIIQVYEICLILCNHDDHNVITTSLETLQQLLTSPVFEISHRFTSPDGIQNSFNSEEWVSRNQELGAPTSLPQHQWTSLSSELSETDEPSTLLLERDLDFPLFRSELSSTTSEIRDELGINIEHRDSQTGAGSQGSLEVASDEEQFNPSINTIELEAFPELQIGSLYDKNVPLYYCTRFLSYNFLLAGRKGFERSDNEIRVTVKVLALNCIMNSIQLCPVVYLLPLSPAEVEPEEIENQQAICDVSLYSKHHDPLLRGSTYLLIGHFLNRILRMNNGMVENTQTLEELVSILVTGLVDKSNIGVKYALSAVSECFVTLLRSRDGASFLGDVFGNLFAISCNPYWLVKVTLVELLAGIEWDSVIMHEELQDRAMNLLLHLLSDEDVRVRSSSISALIKFIQACGNREDWIMGNLNTYFSRSVIEAISCDMFGLPDKLHFRSNVSKYLEKVLNRIIPHLGHLDDKHSIAGFYSALASLSDSFPPSVYKSAWRCGSQEAPMLFFIVVELLQSSPIVSDMFIHQNLLTLASNIFLAMINRNIESPPDENYPFIGSPVNLSVCGLYLLHHTYAIVKLYKSVLSSQVVGGGTTSQKKPSPVLSPAKKLIKDSSDRKATDGESDKKPKPLQRQQSNLHGIPVCPVQMKRIEDSVQQSWKVYKSNLDPLVTHRFTCVLVTSLEILGSIFGWTRYDYPGITTVIEDLLAIAPNIFILTPVPTLKCIKQILRCLNFSSSAAVIDETFRTGTEDTLADFLEFCDNFYKRLAAGRKILVYQTPSEKSCLGAHIRSFEPIVISALKTYWASSDSSIQAEILLFVSELVKGHVNYAMVDSSQVFLNSVIKQFGFLEDGHIRNSATLVDAMFEYFTHLSHIDRQTKKFIDTPKMLQLCDDLVASGQNPATNYIPALKKIVYDLFIYRGNVGVSNLEKKEIEAQREVLFQNILKLGHIPETLPILFVLLHGRRGISEAKWSTESGIVSKVLLDSIETHKLIIKTSTHFHCLIGIFFSVHATTLPSLDKLRLSLSKALQTEGTDPNSLKQWMVIVNTNWLVMLRTIHQYEETVSSKLLLRILLKFVDSTNKLFTWTRVSDASNCSFAVEQLVVFLKATTLLLRKEASGELASQLIAEENVLEFSKISDKLVKMSVANPVFRKVLCDMLTVLNYPWIRVWESILHSWQPAEAKEVFISNLVSTLVKDLVSSVFGIENREFRTIHHKVSTDPEVELWLIREYADYIIQQSHTAAVASFWTRISDSSRDLLVQKLFHMTDQPKLSVLQVKSILRFMERAYEKYKIECSMVSIKLLNMNTIVSTSFDVVQFACFLYVHLHGQEILFSENDLKILKKFLSEPSNNLRYPRLSFLIKRLLGEVTEEKPMITSRENDFKGFKEEPIFVWCCDEINPSEGAALAQILSNLKYTQIYNVLNYPNFNLTLLKHVFQYLHSQLHDNQIQVEDLICLLTTEKHSNLMEKLPLGVAGLEFVVEMLDNWETLIPENLLISVNKNLNPSILNVAFRSSICDMWEILTEILKLKATVLSHFSSQDKILHSNYIPTTIFTFSFQLMRALFQSKEMEEFPLNQLYVFLQFAYVAITDSSFLHFFNVRDHSLQTFSCILSLGSVLREIISKFRIPYVSTQTEESWSELHENCVVILKEFNFMLDVIGQVRSGIIYIEPTLFELVENLVGELGRCEVVNGWLLISHLGWKPPLANLSQIFPLILHIPLEILQNEKDLLQKYIFKLKLFRIASKIQFEENWMTFLSVINSYGDEQCHIQVITIGLQGLSLLLEQAVTIVYTPDLSSSKLVNGFQKINLVLKDLEPKMCGKNLAPLLYTSCQKSFHNEFHIDITSCIRFLTDLFSQWFRNSQGKMPLFLISKVVENIVNISKYFDDTSQFVWMFDTLWEVYKASEKEDEVLWSHLIYGTFVAASRISVEPETLASLGSLLEIALVSSSANVANVALESVLIYLQSQWDSPLLLNIVIPYVLTSTQLSETVCDTESHSYNAWKVLLFIWIYCSPSDAVGVMFEQDVLGNILTVLSPLNKVHVSIRLLVLESLRARVEMGNLKPETKKKITKVALETLRTPNMAIFYESIKLFLTIFYCDFAEFYGVHDPDPEVLMQMVERSEILFQLLKSGRKYNSKVASRVLPVLLMDFLPPSEILNRVMSQFLSPSQTSPELLAPTIAQIFEKARRKPQEAALVREWIIASMPNFLSSPDVARTMWNLTLFFIGVSTSPDISILLPFAQLRRNVSQIKKMFVHSALDYYSTLSPTEQEKFHSNIRKGPFSTRATNPYEFLIDLINNLD